MKSITFFAMLILYLSFPLGLKAQEEYVLSTGDSIQVFIYQYQLSKEKTKSARLKKLEKSRLPLPGLGMRGLERQFMMERKRPGFLKKEIEQGRGPLTLRNRKVEIYLKKKGIFPEEIEKRRDIIVRPDGKVTIPLIGEIEASGKTIRELDEIITERLKPYMPDPEVTVMLTDMAYNKSSICVLGEVGKPGLYPVAGEMSLLKVLAMAGSVTKNASLSRIYLYRETAQGKKIIPIRAEGLIDRLNLRENIRLYPGDVIYVPRSKMVVLNDYIGRYITPLEFLILLCNLSDTGRLDIYSLALGLTYGFKWVFFDEYPGLATASINIPMDSWIYQDLDELAVKDLVTTRPLTRNEAGLLIKKIEDRENLGERDRKALERLEREFEQDKNIRGYIRTGLLYLDNHDERYFDYSYDQNWFGHGLNPRTELSLGGDIFPKLSYNLTGSLWYNGDKSKADLKESYVKLNFKNLEIEAGRDHMWWGPGYHGSLLLSDNAPPFNLVKLTTRQDRFKFTTFLTRLEEDRHIPRPYLNGMRFEWLPFPDFTLGGSRMIMFMGRGRPSLKLKDIPTVLSGENVGERLETNQLAGLDFSWRIKALEFYGNWAGEDQANGLPSAEGYQLGSFIKDFFHKDLDLRIEYAINRKKPHQQATWYEHHLYQTGYRYKGQIIGHHMGGDSQDIFLRLGYRISPRLKSAFEFDYERHGMIKSIEERESRYGIELGYELTPVSSMFIKCENWRTKNDNFVSGEDARDSFIRMEWEYRF